MEDIKRDPTSTDSAVSRRNFLRGALAAVAVAGFDAHFRIIVRARVRFALDKQAFDPDALLAPGQRIFT
jgi:hypothetical protein